MRLTRTLLIPPMLLAVTLAPAAPASAAGDVTWARVQAAAQQAQQTLTQGGGTALVEVASKISFSERTDYRPGGDVSRLSYREAGTPDSQPDEITWKFMRAGVTTGYQPMPAIPRPGRYPTLRTASWVRLNPPQAGESTPPALRLLAYPPLGEITSSTNDTGVVSATWSYGMDEPPDSTVSATFTQLPSGALLLSSFATTSGLPSGAHAFQSVELDFTSPRLIVPDVSHALPETYVKAALRAADNTTLARACAVNAASDARKQAAVLTRSELIDYARTQVATWQDFAHPPANPSTDIVTAIPDGVRITNHNAYSGQTNTWTLVVTPDKRLVVTRKTKPSKVRPVP